jgi:hypothetical protein
MIWLVAIREGRSGHMEGGEARMRQVHPLVGRREAELRGVWSAAWMSVGDDEVDRECALRDRKDGY